MALKVKAKEQLIKIGKYADTYRYVMMPELYTALAQDKVIKEAALRSGVSRGVMQACWDAAGEVEDPDNGTTDNGSTDSGNGGSTENGGGENTNPSNPTNPSGGDNGGSDQGSDGSDQ